ncbi:MAG: hypothetical protein EAZ84_12205 [Verrucomicrobia bacterium]|nr:MAG: hypothetical protein EAZ84_12205 [Verrucomicrobiota bacterium]TAF26568.1 MAG: hypothetical protein EAZ71_04975 [Verrucomicrobiota bacterium]
MRFIILFITFLASPHVWAEQKPLTAEALLKGCEYTLLMAEGKKLSAEEMALSARATSYVDGYIDAIAMAQGINPNFQFTDVKQERKLATYIREIAEFIRKTPQVREQATARVALMLALKESHPPEQKP